MTELIDAISSAPHSRFYQFSAFFGLRVMENLAPDIRIHDLRHIYVMIAYASGVPLEIIAEHVGHEDAKLTEDVYLNIPKEILREKATAVGNTIEEIRRTEMNRKTYLITVNLHCDFLTRIF